jgi:hypothetical protein
MCREYYESIFKNEQKPICTYIFIHSLKYINIFLILYTKCARKFIYVLQCAANQESLRTTALDKAKINLYCFSKYRLIVQNIEALLITRISL